MHWVFYLLHLFLSFSSHALVTNLLPHTFSSVHLPHAEFYISIMPSLNLLPSNEFQPNFLNLSTQL